MELLSPSFSLILWSLLFILPLALLVIALIKLVRSNYEGTDKLMWSLIILFVPFIGAIMFLIMGRKKQTTDNIGY